MRVESMEELARVLWAKGLSRWFAARPGWRLLEPEFAAGSVTFSARRTGEPLRFRVEPKTGGAGGIVALPVAPGEDGSALAELISIVELLDRKGLGVRLDRQDPAPPPPNPPGTRITAPRLELFIASGCNLDCSFCCEAERIAKKSFMPWPEIEQKLRDAAAAGKQLIQFMGGEPTIHPRFADAVGLARELGMRTFVISNIMRWEDPEFARAVGPLLDEIMVSVHAFGDDKGLSVTGRKGWWQRFAKASAELKANHRGSYRCATVLSRLNVDDLDRIAGVVLAFRPTAWVLGNAVPVPGTRIDAELTNLSLTEQIALRPRFAALKERCAAEGCRLVFFCVPHCVLGPELWDNSHDLFLGDQDLSDGAARGVNFWSRADYHEDFAPVTLARERGPACAKCERKNVCGGYFCDYFRRHGEGELSPVTAPS